MTDYFASHVEYLMLLYLIFICAVAAVTDWKRGKIYNKWLKAGMCPGIVLAFLYYFWHRELISLFLTNLLSALVIAILFFAWKLWGAGDSKLWLFVNFIYPAGWYAVSDKMLFPSMIMFMMIFIEAYIYLLGESLWLTVFHKERAVTFHQGKIQLEQLWDIGFSILFLSLVYTACSYVLGDYFESNRIFFSLIGILMTNKLVSARIQHKKIWTICMLTVYSLLSFTFWGGYDFRTLGMTVILVVVTHFSLKFTDRFNYEWIRTCDVKAGMILSYFVVQQFYGSRVKGLPTTTDETTKSRITQEEADSIKRWEKSKYGKEQIMVVRYIPFAVFILIGMITYLIGVWRLK